MEQEFIAAASQYGSSAGALLMLGYVIWKIIEAVKGRDNPTHATLETHMAACEKRLHDNFNSLRNELDESCREIRAMRGEVTWLKDIHDRRDEDGLPIWYNKRSLENKIIELADTLSTQTRSIDRLCNLLESEIQSHKKQ